MRKDELVARIANKTGINKSAVLVVINEFIESVKELISLNKIITFRGFGSFSAKTRQQKVGRHIKNNTPIILPAHKIPFFKPYNEFKDMVKKVSIN